LDGINFSPLINEFHITLHSIPATTVDHQTTTGYTAAGTGTDGGTNETIQATYLPRPLLIYHRGGQPRNTIDLVSLSLNGGTLSEMLRAVVVEDHLKQQKMFLAMCTSTGTGTEEEGTRTTTSNKNVFEWHSSATALLDDIFGTDVFESSNVIMIGLFGTAPTLGWSSNAFQKAAQLWQSSTTTTVHHQEPQDNQPNDGGGEENKEEEEERRGKVQFVGTHDAQIARLVRQNLTDNGRNRLSNNEEITPMVVALKRSENVLMWMMPSDIDDPQVIVDHCVQALDMTPKPEFSRYTPATSREIWGSGHSVHVLITVDEDEKNALNVKQQLKAAQSIVAGLPNAHFAVVPRNLPENKGILSFVDLSSNPRNFLSEEIKNNVEGGAPANLVIVDRSKKNEPPQKYRLYPDYLSTSSSVRLNAKEIRSFVRNFLEHKLTAHWKSEAKSTLLPQVDSGVTAISGLDLQELVQNDVDFLWAEESEDHTKQQPDIVLSFEASWCRTCASNMPRLKEAAKQVQNTFPRRLVFASINLEKNEIEHLLTGVSLRQQPWQYTMPMLFIRPGQNVESLPWRGSRGALPINEEELTNFLVSKDGYELVPIPVPVVEAKKDEEKRREQPEEGVMGHQEL